MTLNNKIINPYFQKLIFNGKSKKPKYFWSLTDNNFRIIDHKNRIAYSVRDLGLGHFDNINRMITISVIIVSGFHCSEQNVLFNTLSLSCINTQCNLEVLSINL
jgi:hypothetical protein